MSLVSSPRAGAGPPAADGGARGMAAASPASHKGPPHALRGRIIKTREGAPLFVTLYPSFLLRLTAEDAKAQENARFAAELGEAKAPAGRPPAEALDTRS